MDNMTLGLFYIEVHENLEFFLFKQNSAPETKSFRHSRFKTQACTKSSCQKYVQNRVLELSKLKLNQPCTHSREYSVRCIFCFSIVRTIFL